MFHTDALNADWLVPDRVLYIFVTGAFLDEHCFQFDQVFCDYLDQKATTKIHLILQAQDLTAFPSIKTAVAMRYMRHPRLGEIHGVSYSHNLIMRFLVATMASLARLPYRELPTFDEACQHTVRSDLTLPPLHTWSLPAHAPAVFNPPAREGEGQAR